MNFPSVADSNFSAVIQPNTGHGLNLYYNATGGYDVINTFLNSKGLMSSWVIARGGVDEQIMKETKHMLKTKGNN